MMLDEMDREEVQRICRGSPMPNDGMWISGPSDPIQSNSDGNKKEKEINKLLSMEFHRRRDLLADHIRIWKMKSNDHNNI